MISGGLTAEERYQNIKDIFQAEPRFVRGKTILVVDDITTTGSIIEECSKSTVSCEHSRCDV
jgi:predicted amidophosphoribosyltransferase